jgi:hypothetical protein
LLHLTQHLLHVDAESVAMMLKLKEYLPRRLDRSGVEVFGQVEELFGVTLGLWPENALGQLVQQLRDGCDLEVAHGAFAAEDLRYDVSKTRDLRREHHERAQVAIVHPCAG